MAAGPAARRPAAAVPAARRPAAAVPGAVAAGRLRRGQWAAAPKAPETGDGVWGPIAAASGWGRLAR